MQRNRPAQTLVAILVGVVGLSLFFQFGLRLKVLDAFRAEGTEVPFVTALALSGWLQPAAVGVSLALAAVAIAAPLKPRRRHWVLGCAISLAGFAFAFAVVAALVPIFNP